MSVWDRAGNAPSSGGKTAWDRSKGGRKGTGRRPSKSKPSKTDLAIMRARGSTDTSDDGGNIFTNAAGDIKDITLGTPAAVKGIGVATKNTVENKIEDVERALSPGGVRRRRDKKKHDFTLADIGEAIVQDYRYRWGPLFTGDFGTFLDRFEDDPIFDLLDIIAVVSGGTSGAVKAGLLKGAPRTRTLRLPSGEKVTKPVVGTELSRRLRLGAQQAATRLLDNEAKQAAKVQRRQLDRQNLSREARLEPYLAAADRLPKKQKIAISLLAEFVTRQKVLLEADRLRSIGETKQAALYSDPQVLNFIDRPTKRMQKVLDMEDRFVVPLRQEIFDRTRTVKGEEVPLLGKKAMEQRRWLPLLAQRGVKVIDDELVAPPGKTIDGMIDDLRAELGGKEPRYRPQKMDRDPGTAGYGAGGSVEQRSPIRRNRLQLFAAGKIARSIDTLGPNTMRLLRYALYSDKHKELVRGAKPHAGEVVDGKKWKFVKAHRNEKIGHMEQNKAAWDAELEEALKTIDLDNPDDMGEFGTELTTLKSSEAAVDAAGNRLVVPANYADTIIGDFTRNNHTLVRALRDVTSVWRALVLNLRVGWLVNNLIGNTFLFAVKSAGIGGLKAYWQEVLNSPGGKIKAHRMLSDPMIRGKYSPEFWAENFGDQVLGTFFGTQTPEAGRVAQILNSRWSPSRYTRQFDVGYEKRMRKAMVDVYIKRNPATKAFYDAMPKQTRSWEAAARKGFENDPQLAARISEQVNNALGDFLHMSWTEKTILRGAMPFYGWYQAIVKIMLKMPIDSPYRTTILANMGKVGSEWAEDYGLPWLEGAIPLDDKGLVLPTQAMNPYSTPYSLGRGVFASDWYGARQREGVFNPLLPLFGHSIFDEGPWQKNLATGAKEFGMQLPFSRVAFPQERASYSTDPRIREALGYLGLPIKRVRGQDK